MNGCHSSLDTAGHLTKIYCPTSILKPFFIIWSSIVLKGWITTYSQRDKGKKKRQKEKAVFPDHWFYLSFIILSYEGKEGRWNFVPSKLGVRSNAWQPGETLQKMLNFWLRYLFHTALAVPPKGIGHTGTSCDTSPDLCMHIANSRCTLHSGTVLMKLGVCINKELSYR